MSEEAFQAGGRKHVPLVQAARLFRDAKIAAPRPHRYERAMAELLALAPPLPPSDELASLRRQYAVLGFLLRHHLMALFAEVLRVPGRGQCPRHGPLHGPPHPPGLLAHHR